MKPQVPKGYTAAELERDNPYNAWMFEDAEKEDDIDPEDPDAEPGYCTSCAGSGEGMHEGSRCSSCKGTGVER